MRWADVYVPHVSPASMSPASMRRCPRALSPGARCEGPTSTSACWPTVLPSGIVALRGSRDRRRRVGRDEGPMAERWLSLSWWWACESRRGRSRRGSGRCSGPPFDGPPLRTGTSVTAEVFGDDGANLVRQRHFEFSEGYLARSCPKALSQFSRW